MLKLDLRYADGIPRGGKFKFKGDVEPLSVEWLAVELESISEERGPKQWETSHLYITVDDVPKLVLALVSQLMQLREKAPIGSLPQP